MTRLDEERVADVRRLLAAAARLHARRAGIAAEIAASTGLSPEGVELGFESLERAASDADLRALSSSAGAAAHVHVILSANVFVAPLRAIALARAAAPRVTVRASPRDPVLTREIVAEARDPGIALTPTRDVAALEADVIHVYGREDTIAAVRARARAGVAVRAHGPGMGAAVITARAEIGAAAEALARDVVTFDQRGCLSPRAAWVEDRTAGAARSRAFAEALGRSLDAWGARVPRGLLDDGERAASVRWTSAMAFAGPVRQGADHAVAVVPADAPASLSVALPPAGRHVLVLPAPELGDPTLFSGIARHLVAIGSDDPERIAPLAPRHARISPLGRMQRPPLDGPVDRR